MEAASNLNIRSLFAAISQNEMILRFLSQIKYNIVIYTLGIKQYYVIH